MGSASRGAAPQAKAQAREPFRPQKYQVFTIEECHSCAAKKKTPFQHGEYIYKPGSACAKCGSNDTLVTMIYSEQIKHT